MTAHTRARGEGSIYPYRNGRYAAYVWVTTLTGERRRKYVYGDTRPQVHARWIELHHDAARSALPPAHPGSLTISAAGCGMWSSPSPSPRPPRPTGATSASTSARISASSAWTSSAWPTSAAGSAG